MATRVVVSCLGGDTVADLDLPVDATIAKVKELISERGIPVKEQRLLSGPEVLQDSDAVPPDGDLLLVRQRPPLPENCLFQAIEEKNVEKCLAILGRDDFSEVNKIHWCWKTTVHAALSRSLPEVARAILARNDYTEVNTRGVHAETALHVAAHGHTELVAMILARKDFTEINSKNVVNMTALHAAAESGCCEAASAILAHPDFISINDADNFGRTALHIAASSIGYHPSSRRRGKLEIIRTLLASAEFIAVNTRTTHPTWKGRTALHEALRAGGEEHSSAILAHPDLDINARDADGRNALHYATSKLWPECPRHLASAIASRADFDVNATDSHGWSALQLAAESGCGDVGIIVLSRSDFAGINATDLCGRTVLHSAVRNHLPALASAVLLHEGFVEVDAKASGVWTALHLAVAHGLAGVVARILDHRDFTAVHAEDPEGKTALDRAEERNHPQIAAAIRSRRDLLRIPAV